MQIILPAFGAILGLDALPLEVEVNNHPGTNNVYIVGLPDLAVKESRDTDYPGALIRPLPPVER